MKVITEKARLLGAAVAVRRGVPHFDPTIIILVFQALIEILRMWQDCRKNPEEALDTAKNPGILSKWVAGRIMRRHLGKHYNDDFREELNTLGKSITLAEMKRMYVEVK